MIKSMLTLSYTSSEVKGRDHKASYVYVWINNKLYSFTVSQIQQCLSKQRQDLLLNLFLFTVE